MYILYVCMCVFIITYRYAGLAVLYVCAPGVARWTCACAEGIRSFPYPPRFFPPTRPRMDDEIYGILRREEWAPFVM